MNDYELQSHKKSDKIKWIITAIAFVLVFALLGGVYALQFRIGKEKEEVRPSTESFADICNIEANNAVTHSIKAVPVVYSDDVVPYASTGGNGVTKPSNDVLQAEINTYMSENGLSRYDVSNYSSFSRAEVRNNINDTKLTVGDVIKTYGALLSSGNTFFTALLPTFNPFDSLAEEGYGVSQVLEVKGLSSGTLAGGTLNHFCIIRLGLSDLNNYSKYISYQLVFEEKAVPLPEDPVKEGYDFVGWYYGTQAEHGNGASCKAYDGEPIYSNTSLHAHFKIKTFSVTFDSAGGSTVSEKKVDWNTNITAPTCERTGYNFLGWYFPNGTKYEGQAIKEDTVLMAHWEIKRFTVTFYVEGEEYKSMEVDYGTTFENLVESANTLGLRVKSIVASSGEPIGEFVSGDLNINAAAMDDMDRALNTVKNNAWAIVGGVVGGVVLIAAVGAVVGALRRRSVR